jgi:surface antigen
MPLQGPAASNEQVLIPVGHDPRRHQKVEGVLDRFVSTCSLSPFPTVEPTRLQRLGHQIRAYYSRMTYAPRATFVLVGLLIAVVLFGVRPATAGARPAVRGGNSEGFRAELNVDRGSRCTLVGLRDGRHVGVVRFSAERRGIQVTWRVPADAESGTWQVRVLCEAIVAATGRVSVRGTGHKPHLIVTGSAHVHQSGATLSSTVAIQEPEGENSSANGSCPSPSGSGLAPSAFNTTPTGELWQVPIDPCNNEGKSQSNYYDNCAYWAAEKRPDIWVEAVWKYGYPEAPGGAWNIELDAAKAGFRFPIDHVPAAGDIAAWPDNASMGSTVPITGIGGAFGGAYASEGGHVAYVEAIEPEGVIVISQMGAVAEHGETIGLRYNAEETFFIHRK